MGSGTAIYVACCAAYMLTGGSWIVVMASVLVYLFDNQQKASGRGLRGSHRIGRDGVRKPQEPQKVSTGASRIYEIDFTSASTDEIVPLTKKSVTTRAKRSPRVIKASKPQARSVPESVRTFADAQVYVLYTSLTGSTLRAAKAVCDQVSAAPDIVLPPIMMSMDEDVDDLEQYFLKTPENAIYVLVLPSYDTDSPIDYFLEHLTDTANDFRVDSYPLSLLRGFAVLGMGDSESWPGPQFCYQAKLADRAMAKLGARRLFPVGQICVKQPNPAKTVEEWAVSFASLLTDIEPYAAGDAEDSDSDDAVADAAASKALADLEDLAAAPKEMVPKGSHTYQTLTKQGYVIVGSHSGVKICRWTRSALRGRGSCYKFAFYGIKSHLCMETTPSLACANKCVFCWRHGTNPVAKLKWRWNVDSAQTVLDGALRGHYQKIKQMRGVPGVQADRFNEALTVRHCALSLVGEPIFYPHINEFVGMLHDQHISSFLVCNAQHPDNLAALSRVTQLYVSIDAASRDSLRKIDRPLNLDFWERLGQCLDILKTTQSHQRTVFRLTLVKGFNMGEIAGYADMVERAAPSQIEVKGATFCGSSTTGDSLTMQNMPFYEECCSFVEALVSELQSRGQKYSLAAAHAHSCCLLIAHERFRIDGQWHTHIDYQRFFELLKSGQEFRDVDYISPTPAWAVWGAPEGGFNPVDTRFDRQGEKRKRRLAREAAKAEAEAGAGANAESEPRQEGRDDSAATPTLD